MEGSRSILPSISAADAVLPNNKNHESPDPEANHPDARRAGGRSLRRRDRCHPLDRKPLNVFVFGDMSESNVDSEGRVAVGGNATLTNYGVGSAFQSNPSSAGDTLVVGGDLSYNGGEVHYGNVVYGGTLTGSASAPNGTVTQGSVIDFTAAETELTNHSAHWSGLDATGTTVNNFGGIQLIGVDPEINIFTLAGIDLNGAWGVTIDAPSGSTVLVNVSGLTNDFDNMGINFQDLNNDSTGITDKQHVLFNFYESTSLSISGISVQGSVLAPSAAVTFGNGNIEGNLIANSLTGSGEAHNDLFSGTLPDIEAIPEPNAGFFAAIGGFLWLALLRRRDHR